MWTSHSRNHDREHDTEATEELIGLLTAISIVSKRLAKNLTLLRAIEKRGDAQNVRAQHAHAHAD